MCAEEVGLARWEPENGFSLIRRRPSAATSLQNAGRLA